MGCNCGSNAAAMVAAVTGPNVTTPQATAATGGNVTGNVTGNVSGAGQQQVAGNSQSRIVYTENNSNVVVHHQR